MTHSFPVPTYAEATVPGLGVELTATGTGARVMSVRSDGAARNAGIERGDVIVQVADRAVFTPEEVENAFATAGRRLGADAHRPGAAPASTSCRWVEGCHSG